MKPFSALILLCFLYALPVSAQQASDIYWMTEEYPPYNFLDTRDNQIKGIAVDVLTSMFKQAGFQSRAELTILPWSRGYRYLQELKNTALFSTTYTEERQKKFVFVGPIIPTKISLIARADRQLKIDDDADLTGLRIGVVQDDVGAQLLAQRNLAGALVVNTFSGQSLIRMLASGRVDAIAYAEDVAYFQLLQEGMPLADYQAVYLLKESHIGYAFNRSVDPLLIDSLSHALDRLKQDGTVARIYQQYINRP